MKKATAYYEEKKFLMEFLELWNRYDRPPIQLYTDSLKSNDKGSGHINGLQHQFIVEALDIADELNVNVQLECLGVKGSYGKPPLSVVMEAEGDDEGDDEDTPTNYSDETDDDDNTDDEPTDYSEEGDNENEERGDTGSDDEGTEDSGGNSEDAAGEDDTEDVDTGGSGDKSGDDSDDEVTDYSEEDEGDADEGGEDTGTDTGDTEDTSDDTEGNESEGDDGADDTEDSAGEDGTEDVDAGGDGDESGDDPDGEVTDYGEEAGGTEDDSGGNTEGGDDDSTEDTASDEQNETPDTNILVKNFSLMRDFEKMYSLITDNINTLNSTLKADPGQNRVLVQVSRNLTSIKDFILTYVQFHFKNDNYQYNLYYYEVVVQLLKLNLNMLEKALTLGDSEKDTKKEVNKNG
ncbi:MAG: hypothetical protein NC548_27820 [Lachnospiraceae bacterium]|nr:hypothetical protein [Lachnospiraceae bacterium]